MASPILYAQPIAETLDNGLTILPQLLKAIKKRPGADKRQIDREAVLLRAYGKGTDVLIDRESKEDSSLRMRNNTN